MPEEQVHELRLQLAGEGLPRGGNVGFEIFDSPSFGMSHFAEQLNYHRALEGELRRTIRQLDAVREARVHIVMPEKSFFREQEQPATASVTVQLAAGRHLSGTQVQAIVHLVSASVQGLSPQQVTVVDSAGTILAKGGESANDSGAELDKQRALERGLEDRVQHLLVPLVGEGHSVVRVSAALDFSHVERTSEKYDPGSSIVRSEQFQRGASQPHRQHGQRHSRIAQQPVGYQQNHRERASRPPLANTQLRNQQNCRARDWPAPAKSLGCLWPSWWMAPQ